MNLEELMAETQKVMARNLAESFYGDDSHEHKPVRWTWQSEVVKWHSRLGQFFLSIAHYFGEYDDPY